MEEGKVTIYPLYDLQAVLNVWKDITPGLEAILDNSGQDTSIEKILNDILSGRLLLWIAFVEGVYAGFFTTMIQRVPTAASFLWVIHAQKNRGMPTEFLLEAYCQLENFAREQKLDFIKFYSKRKAWQSNLVALGFYENYIEYVKDIRSEKPKE